MKDDDDDDDADDKKIRRNGRRITRNRRRHVILGAMCNKTVCNDVNNQQDATAFSFINLFNSAVHFGGIWRHNTDNAHINTHSGTIPVILARH